MLDITLLDLRCPSALDLREGVFESLRLEETVELGSPPADYLHHMSIYSTDLLPDVDSADRGNAREEGRARVEPLAARYSLYSQAI
jgi:hypothetical protein